MRLDDNRSWYGGHTAAFCSVDGFFVLLSVMEYSAIIEMVRSWWFRVFRKRRSKSKRWKLTAQTPLAGRWGIDSLGDVLIAV